MWVNETTKLCLTEQPSLTLFKLLISGMLLTPRKSLDGITDKMPLFTWKQILLVANEDANTRIGLSFLDYKTPDHQQMFNFPPPPRFSRCDFQASRSNSERRAFITRAAKTKNPRLGKPADHSHSSPFLTRKELPAWPRKLSWAGSGPERGLAATLGTGILANPAGGGLRSVVSSLL